MKDYCYIGRDDAGKLCAVVWDNPKYREDVADTVAEMIRAGYVISRVEGPVMIPELIVTAPGIPSGLTLANAEQAGREAYEEATRDAEDEAIQSDIEETK